MSAPGDWPPTAAQETKTDPSEPMKTFIGSLASATARPQRSEDSQAGGCPRPAPEGKEKGARPVMGSPE
jgi:hypothetical protein